MAVVNCSKILWKPKRLCALRQFMRSDKERGSISVITIGLFLITIALIGVITDIAAIAVAKRSLVHVTEAAALRAAHILNERAYYEGGASTGVPIDCASAREEVSHEFDSWIQGVSNSRRPEIEEIWVTGFNCYGSYLGLSSTARVRLPFRLPSTSLETVEIQAVVAAESDRNT